MRKGVGMVMMMIGLVGEGSRRLCMVYDGYDGYGPCRSLKGGAWAGNVLCSFSPLVLHVLDRVHNFIHEFEGDTWDHTLGLCERLLEVAECNPGFLCGDSGEQL
jgi:hypothetical protein